MELCTSPCGKYRIETMTPKTFPGALNMIREEFNKEELVCIGTEVNINPEAGEELLELCADAALDGVSVVAVEINTGEVAAACFNKLQVSNPDKTEKPFFEVFAEERCKHPSSQALVSFMAELDQRVNMFELYDVDCSIELTFLATLKEHRRQKLGYLCSKASLDIGRMLRNGPVSKLTVQDLGPAYAHIKPRTVTEKVPKISQMLCTAIASQKIAKSLNFTVHSRISFTEFVYKGKSYAERAGFDPYCEAVARRID